MGRGSVGFLACARLSSQDSYQVVAAPETTVLVACERRDEDGIDDFLARLGEDFSVVTAWTNFADAELPDLLRASHVKGPKKPLRIYSITRHAGPAAGERAAGACAAGAGAVLGAAGEAGMEVAFQAGVGVVGLGVMGSALAMNLAERAGVGVAGLDLDDAKVPSHTCTREGL